MCYSLLGAKGSRTSVTLRQGLVYHFFAFTEQMHNNMEFIC